MTKSDSQDTKVVVHNYVGMKLPYNGNKTVSIEMSEYITEVIQTFSAESKVNSDASTPAKVNLFTVDTLSKRLDTQWSKIFHHCICQVAARFQTLQTGHLTCHRFSMHSSYL